MQPLLQITAQALGLNSEHGMYTSASVHYSTVQHER
jgi:hypothetical protein